MPRPRTVKPRSSHHGALGDAIKLLMAEDPRMTFDTVVDDSGLNEKLLGEYIRGQGNPTYSNLLKLSKGLHVSVATLMLRAEELYAKRHTR